MSAVLADEFRRIAFGCGDVAGVKHFGRRPINGTFRASAIHFGLAVFPPPLMGLEVRRAVPVRHFYFTARRLHAARGFLVGAGISLGLWALLGLLLALLS